MNSNKKMQMIGMIALIAIALFASQSFALAIHPAKKTLNFEPGLVKTYSFAVSNENKEPVLLNVYAEGELKEYIRIHTEQMTAKEGDNEISYSVEFPNDAQLPPGDNLVKIIVEHAEQINKSGVSMTAKLKLGYKITIKVPYPKKFVEASFNIESDSQNVWMTTTVENRGADNIGAVIPTYHIKDGEKEVQTASASEAKKLSKGQKTTFETALRKDLLPIGLYEALAVISYDEKVLELSSEFKIGEESLSLANYDKFLKFGGVNQFVVEAKNEWNKEIKGAYFELRIFDSADSKSALSEKSALLESKKTIAEAKSRSVDIPPGKTEAMNAYADVRNIAEGAYNAELALYYSDKTAKLPFKIEILPAEQYDKKTKMAGTGSAVSSAAGEGMLTATSAFVIAGLIFAVAVVTAAILFFINKLKAQKKAQGEELAGREHFEKHQAEEHQELDRYIASGLRNGISKETIRRALIHAGWAEQIVNQKLLRY